MRTRVEIHKKVGEIFCELWLENGCPVSVDFGRTREGMVDMLLEHEESDCDTVNGLLAEAMNIYQEQLP